MIKDRIKLFSRLQQLNSDVKEDLEQLQVAYEASDFHAMFAIASDLVEKCNQINKHDQEALDSFFNDLDEGI